MLIIPKVKPLEPIVPQIMSLSESLCQIYPVIELPETLILRYLKPYKKIPRDLTLAYYGVNGGQHYLALRNTLADERLDNVLRHEVAHMCSIGLTGEWTHNNLFWEMLDILNNQRGEIALLDMITSIVVWGWLIIAVMKLLKILL